MRRMEPIDLNLLPTLDALLQEGSVTRAARRIGLPVAATSHALRAFEAPTCAPDGACRNTKPRAVAFPSRSAA